MMDLPEAERRNIEQYVNTQSPKNDRVVLVQKVGSRRIVGRTHELYDVHCQNSRWWVVTDPTNLYSQADFPKIEQAFIFHLGLGLFMAERSRGTLDEPEEQFISGAWRRYKQALEAMDTAQEAEDYQSVGIICRQALLALVSDHASSPWLQLDGPPPKGNDFKGWMTVIATSLSRNRMRSYVTALAEKTWDLTVWLQHYEDANPWGAELVLEATQHMLAVVGRLVHRHEHGELSRCPRCGSYRLDETTEVVEDPEPGYLATEVCGACGWEGDAVFTSWREHFKDVDPQRLREYLESPGIVSDRLNRSEAPPSTGSAPGAAGEQPAK
jgi:hypothetical protein